MNIHTCGGESSKGSAAKKSTLGARLDRKTAASQTTCGDTVPNIALRSQLNTNNNKNRH
jgi:uncharacterized protein (DUF169 family)